ncbi:PAS domain-containing protein [Cnuella takakiae]|uniref:histidine kinase n=1 Tax=Cnuella takakiae TaxID=1302690 RepID=A0A1M4XB66_9BACT|nr:ATP-binding protein [Cnuella takakiae]OLY91477.1 hypothetical protein BUE76_05850 [Cnuella takakiae]SHE90774.1 PAS domain-containing protein [Cnuella takakiae]
MTSHEALNPTTLATLLDQLPDAVLWLQVITHPHGHIEDLELLFANQSAQELLGVSKAELPGLHLLRDRLPLEPSGALLQYGAAALAENKTIAAQLQYAGTPCSILVKPYAGGLLCSMRTVPVPTEQAAGDMSQLRSLKWMIDHSPIGMVLYEAQRDDAGAISDFVVKLYNRRSNELVGISEAQRKSYTFRQVLELLGIGHVFQYYVEIVETGALLQVEQFIPASNKWLFISTLKLEDGFLVMHTDISELKRSQQALQDQSNYLNSILNASLNAVVVMEAVQDEEGGIIDFVYRQVNTSFLNFVRKTEAEVLHQRMLSTFPSTASSGIFDVYRDVVETGSSSHVELPYTTPDKEYWLDLRIAPLESNRIVGTFTDITPRKEAFRQMERQKKLLDNILRFSSNGIAVSEIIRDASGKVVDGRTLLANEAASKFTGLPLDIYLSKTATELDPNIIDSEYYKACIHTLDTGQPILTQYFLESAGKWLELSVSRMDQDRLIHIFTDVTSIKEAQLRLEQTAGELEAVFNAAQAGMFTFAPHFDDAGELVDFRFVMVNPSISSYVQRNPEELKGCLGSEWFPGYLTNGVFDMYKTAYLSGQPDRREVHYHVDGHDSYLDLQCVQVGNHLLVSFTDHTPLRKVQAQLEKTVEDLQRMNANLEQFAYTASHDLKEPIRKINFFSERLRERLDGRLSNEEGDLLNRMEKACERMNTLIDDLLEYSRISRGAFQLEKVALDDTLRTVMENLELQIQESGAQVDAAALPELNGHREQLQQLFQNLLENALKYRHPDRKPQLTIRVVQMNGNDAALAGSGANPARQYHLLSFADNGIGFEAADAERIFQVFTRLHGRSEYAGTGVGLSIARKVAENHNGFIWAEGREGAGAVFWVGLPV